MRGLIGGAILAVVIAAPAHAAMYGPGYAPCGDKQSTSEMVDCIAAKAKAWDQRLNAAWRDLQGRIDPDQRKPLLEAQRLWIRYRDANCRFYAARDGSIRQVDEAECLRAMTEDRALELEHAMAEP